MCRCMSLLGEGIARWGKLGICILGGLGRMLIANLDLFNGSSRDLHRQCRKRMRKWKPQRPMPCTARREHIIGQRPECLHAIFWSPTQVRIFRSSLRPEPLSDTERR